MKIIKKLTLLLPFLFIACDPPLGADVRYQIVIENNTTQNVWYLVSYKYPDTLLPADGKYLSLIHPNSFVYESSRKKWDKVFADNIPGEKMIVFFISDSVRNHYSLEQIRNQNLILKRAEVSFVELVNSNYKISYP